MVTTLRGVRAFFRLVQGTGARRQNGQNPCRVFREPRCEVRIPIWYRVNSQAAWQKAEMINLSLSGILFRCHEPLPEGTCLEIAFRLPTPENSEQHAEVYFSARTMRMRRSRPVPGSTSLVTVAARIAPSQCDPTPPEEEREAGQEAPGPLGLSSLEAR